MVAFMQTAPDTAALVREIRVEMIRHNISRAALADMVGLSYTALSRRFALSTDLTMSEARWIADALGVPLHELIRRASAGVAA